MNNEIYIPQTTLLKNAIRSIWQVNDQTFYQNEIIIPKAVVEIIFDLGENDPIESNINNKQFQLAKCFINGFNTQPIELELPRKQFFFAVQFHPAAIKKCFGVPASEFANRVIDLTLIDITFKTLWQQVVEAKTFKERVDIILKWAENKLIVTHPREQLLNLFLESHHQHDISIKDLAKNLCYSPRHLSRKIQESTGMNTEQALLYKKYLQSVHLMHTANLSLTAIAYQSNFADQSHFIRTFKTFANITPKEYSLQKSNLQGHIYKNVR